MSDVPLTSADVTAWLDLAADRVAEAEASLNRLDAEHGDGDHGSALRRGIEAAADAVGLTDYATAAEALNAAGMAHLNKAGGASGPLFGSALMAMGTSLTVHPSDTGAAIAAAAARVAELGDCEVGDKTMLDALAPAAAATDLADAADAAERGADETAGLEATKGRAATSPTRGLGARDPGAVSVGLLLRALADAVTR